MTAPAVASSEQSISVPSSGHRAAVDELRSTPRQVLMVVANPTVSSNNGWPVGFWAAELTHPYYELTERCVQVTIASAPCRSGPGPLRRAADLRRPITHVHLPGRRRPA